MAYRWLDPKPPAAHRIAERRRNFNNALMVLVRKSRAEQFDAEKGALARAKPHSAASSSSSVVDLVSRLSESHSAARGTQSRKPSQ